MGCNPSLHQKQMQHACSKASNVSAVQVHGHSHLGGQVLKIQDQSVPSLLKSTDYTVGSYTSQVKSAFSYLQKLRSHLLTVAYICHGFALLYSCNYLHKIKDVFQILRLCPAISIYRPKRQNYSLASWFGCERLENAHILNFSHLNTYVCL